MQQVSEEKIEKMGKGYHKTPPQKDMTSWHPTNNGFSGKIT